jgi:ankyrin repeat protein
LKDLPKGLDATYDRMLEKIDTRRRKQVASLLKWLAFSLRPLRLDELAEIFILDHELTVPFDENKRLFTPEDVLKYLPGLVITVPIRVGHYSSIWYNTEAIEIRLAHFSIKEYLISQRMRQDLVTRFSITETNAHLHISESCLAYHLHISKTELATKDSVRRFALWEYAAFYWARHLEEVGRASWTASVTGRAMQVLTPCVKSLLNMVRIKGPGSYLDHNWDLKSEELVLPLCYTASLGAFQITDLLINNGANINEHSPARGCEYALQAAAVGRNTSIVQLFLDKGADINTQGGLYGNALQAAACRGNENMVQLLLDKGADINAQGGHYGNALQAVAYGGSESKVQLLLDKGADINAQGGHYGNALQAAAFCGNESKVQLLLDKGADINAQGGHYGNALQAAAFCGNENMVQLLLDKGADTNAQGGEYGNALQAAVVQDELSVAQLLLSQGAEVNPAGARWEELLKSITKRGHEPHDIDRLRKFQENPPGFLAAARESG